MKFGLYIHIPHSIQKCHYCDFVTLPQNHSVDPTAYMALLLEELKVVHNFFPSRTLDTIYFGGGTPSLMPVPLIVSFLEQIGRYGIKFHPQIEITIEINPGTLSIDDLKALKDAGINRYSLGLQTFDQHQLEQVYREHSVADTYTTIESFKKLDLTYSADLLFTLPHQSAEDSLADVEKLLTLSPQHISPYILNVPKKHPMASGRLPEEAQAELFHEVSKLLHAHSYNHYELSNFSKPRFESQHNLLYWQGHAYWGLGLSAHSSLPLASQFGDRFWNPSNIKAYTQYISSLKDNSSSKKAPYLNGHNYESLAVHEALTDFFHTRLRLLKGLSDTALQASEFYPYNKAFYPKLEKLHKQGLLQCRDGVWALTNSGQTLSNRVYFELTFLEEDLT